MLNDPELSQSDGQALISPFVAPPDSWREPQLSNHWERRWALSSGGGHVGRAQDAREGGTAAACCPAHLLPAQGDAEPTSGPECQLTVSACPDCAWEFRDLQTQEGRRSLPPCCPGCRCSGHTQTSWTEASVVTGVKMSTVLLHKSQSKTHVQLSPPPEHSC